MDQRSSSRMETLVEEDEEEVGQFSENIDEKGIKIPGLDKYNLRTKSIQNRLETEKRKRSPKKEPKPKQRPPPLSKYRRRTANARERTRMQVSNFNNFCIKPQLNMNSLFVSFCRKSMMRSKN